MPLPTSFFRIQLDQVAGGNLEAHALAGFQQFAGGNALGGQAVGRRSASNLSRVGLAVGTLKAKKSMPAMSACAGSRCCGRARPRP
jgi:hypothetical protein